MWKSNGMKKKVILNNFNFEEKDLTNSIFINELYYLDRQTQFKLLKEITENWSNIF